MYYVIRRIGNEAYLIVGGGYTDVSEAYTALVEFREGPMIQNSTQAVTLDILYLPKGA